MKHTRPPERPDGGDQGAALGLRVEPEAEPRAAEGAGDEKSMRGVGGRLARRVVAGLADGASAGWAGRRGRGGAGVGDGRRSLT